MERRRDFAIELYALNSEERHAALAALSPEERKLVPRWRKMSEADIREAQWRISMLTS
jgi:hypothetical protein